MVIGGPGEHIRVLTTVSESVVRALLDEDEAGEDGATTREDPFTAALRRYHDEGTPREIDRRSVAGRAGLSEDAVDVLRRLARDLLRDVAGASGPAPAAEEAPEAPPPNVRRIDQTREVPALELGEDGTWRPSGATLQAAAEVDSSARRRNLPDLRSRYPELRQRGSARSLPPPPPSQTARFTEITVPAELTEPPKVETVAPPPPPIAEPIVAPAAAPQQRESLIRAVAGGTELVVGTFDRFQGLAEFIKALKAVPGVQDVTTRQFVRGSVHLRVRHSPAAELTDLLPKLQGFPYRLVSADRERVELQIER